MFDHCKISIITPTYNRADLLPETIESVLNQTYKNIEYIIVDDGSTDNTEEIVKKYLNDSRVKYYKHENVGESKTVNKGYRLSNGELTIVINSDDPLLENDFFEKVILAFKNNPDVLAVYPSWVDININSVEKNRIDVPQYNLITLLTRTDITLGPGMVIKRNALEKIGFRDESVKYTGDLDISYKIARMGEILHIDSYGASHRSHSSNAQVVGDKNKIAQEILNLNLMIFKEKRKYIPKEIIKNRVKILKKALLLYKCYSDKTYNYKELSKEYPSLFYNLIDKYIIYKQFKKDKKIIIV